MKLSIRARHTLPLPVCQFHKIRHNGDRTYHRAQIKLHLRVYRETKRNLKSRNVLVKSLYCIMDTPFAAF